MQRSDRLALAGTCLFAGLASVPITGPVVVLGGRGSSIRDLDGPWILCTLGGAAGVMALYFLLRGFRRISPSPRFAAGVIVAPLTAVMSGFGWYALAVWSMELGGGIHPHRQTRK